MSTQSTRKNPNNAPGSSPPKKFRCESCQRHFNRREHLQRHERIHYNHKPFRCTHCPYSCRRRISHNPPPSTDSLGCPSPDNGAPDIANDRSVQTSLVDYSRTGAGSNADLDPAVAHDAPGLQQPEMDNLPQYTSQMGDPSTALPSGVQSFFSADQNMQPFTFDFLDNVSLPPLPMQGILYPDLSIFDPLTVSPTTEMGAPLESQVTGIPTHSPGRPARLEPRPSELSTDPGAQHVHVAPILRVSQEDWLWLSAEVARFSSVVPADYVLPSRHSISRYLHGFMDGFHPHFPIIHPQTMSFRSTAPELVLALAAAGSNYCLESHQGLKLFAVARSIALEQVRRRDTVKGGMSQTMAHGVHTSEPRSSYDHGYVETMQAVFFLMAMATWGGEDRSLVRQALAMQSMLAMLARQHGLSESWELPSTWHEWARAESARRTKLIAFCFFNLHSITFNLPSPFLVTDIQLMLPCAEMEWRALDSDRWASIHQRSSHPPFFQECLATLLRGADATPTCSSLGSHVLIHALLQRIMCIQQSIQLEGIESDLVSRLSVTLRRALKKWQSGWERNPESSYSPLAKHGPIAFNSHALFHLAYIRLAVNIGSARSLLEQSHTHIAKRLCDQPSLQRGPLLLLAARHATAALCAPVQMGVHFVGRAPSWSVMHAVCSLEYAYILNQFVRATTAPNTERPLEDNEHALLQTIKDTLREVESSTPGGDPNVIDVAPQLLGAKAVRAWAMILQGMRTWDAVNVITQALFEYADLLEPGGLGEISL